MLDDEMITIKCVFADRRAYSEKLSNLADVSMCASRTRSQVRGFTLNMLPPHGDFAKQGKNLNKSLFSSCTLTQS